MVLFNDIRQDVKNMMDEIVQIRRHLHSYPELSFQEFKTTDYIKKKLSEIGIEYISLKETGVIGIIGNGNQSILLRADIDALPIEESTELAFKSKNKGIMHACGHDLHTAMLLGAGKVLKKYESEIFGRVLLLFQPAEELLPGGAKAIIDSNILETFDIKAAFGQHINPALETGKFIVKSGPFMASTDELYWTIEGHSCHAAQPNIGTDTIMPATAIVQSLQNIHYSFKNPFESSLVSVTAINAGNTTNVFPDIVKMKGTLRCYSNTWRNEMYNILNNKSQEICSIYGAKCSLEIKIGYPSVINDDSMTSLVKETASLLFGNQSIQENEGVMWAEDFGYFSNKYPSCFWFLGTKSKDSDSFFPLHNPKLAPDENSMLIGTRMLSSLAIQYFKR